MKIEHKSDPEARRRALYPDARDYLDAKVKQHSPDPAVRTQGIAQEASYIARCLEIKAQFRRDTI